MRFDYVAHANVKTEKEMRNTAYTSATLVSNCGGTFPAPLALPNLGNHTKMLPHEHHLHRFFLHQLSQKSAQKRGIQKSLGIKININLTPGTLIFSSVPWGLGGWGWTPNPSMKESHEWLWQALRLGQHDLVTSLAPREFEPFHEEEIGVKLFWFSKTSGNTLEKKIDRSINQSINQSITQSINQSINQLEKND